MRASARKLAHFLGLSLAVLLLCLPAFSQLNLGRLSGNVTDESGGTMANAKVVVTDQERGVSRTLTTDEAGAFAAPSLIPGNYTVRVEATGFNTTERKDVLVQVGGDTRVDISMKAGSQTQTVTVTEQLPLINTTSATLGGVMEGSEVTSLPFVGRSYQSLLQFTPGVVTLPGGGSAGHSSNGLRSDDNNWLFEGIFSGGVRTAGSIINTNSNVGDGASVVPPDAIQEFGISFQNKAEYGWKPGVASNVGIKSGTNSIHGTAFAVGQSSSLNARNPFNPAPNPKPLLAYQQYGATAGGPIKKDKLFYFVAFEGMEFTQGTPTTRKTPTTALIAGDTTNSIPAAYLDMAAKGQITAGAIDANGKVANAALLNPAQALSAKLVGLGLFQTGVPTNGVFNYGFTASRSPNKNFIWKVDYHLNDKNQISGEYFFARDNELGNSDSITQNYWQTYFFLTGNVARANWTYLPNSRWVNEAHFGFDRKVENSWPGECTGNGPAAPSYGINTGAPTPCFGSGSPTAFSLPLITINGFNDLGAVTTQQRRVEGYWTLADNVSYTAGNHNMKFGMELRRSYFSGAAYSGERGAVSFGTSSIAAFTAGGVPATSLQSFLAGVPSTGSLLFGDPTVIIRNYALGTFVQDDWRLTPRLTLNLGLRYEYETPITEDNNRLAQFDPNSPIGFSQLGSSGLSQTWKAHVLGANVQPRIGTVWDITGKGTTVVRAAFGLYSNWPIWQLYINQSNLPNNPTAATFVSATGVATQGTGTVASGSVNFDTSGTPPVPTLNWSLAGPIFPPGTIKCGDGLNGHPSPCTAGGMDQHWHLPYAKEWTIAVQHAFTPTIALDLAYVGNHGTDLIGVLDLNMPVAGTSSKSREQLARPYNALFPWIGKITYVTNKDYSNYNALQATLTQRPWHGLSSSVGYTYSHTLDVTQANITELVNPNPLCPECDYGPTGFDVRHRMTVRATYLIPGKKGYGQMLEGWQLSSLVNLVGALPWGGTDTKTDFSGTGENNDRWNLFGNATDFNSFGHFLSVPCWGVAKAPANVASGFGGGTFGKDSACTQVAPGGTQKTTETAANLVANMPPACITAAAGLPTNAAVVTAADKNATGLAALSNFGCYMAGNSVIVPPAQGTLGNMARNIFRGAGLRLWDISVRKNTKFTERLNAEFQFDMYNTTNSPQFAVPTNALFTPATFGASPATPNVAKGNVVQGTGDARRYQFGLKLTF